MILEKIKKMESLGFKYNYCEVCGIFISWGKGDCDLIHDDCADRNIESIEVLYK